MLPFTPFAGLSFFIHGTIIVLATVVGFFVRLFGGMPHYAHLTKKIGRGRERHHFFRQTEALATALGISMFMLSFAGFAVITAYRQGETESHMQYAHELISDFQNWEKSYAAPQSENTIKRIEAEKSYWPIAINQNQ